MTTLSVTPTEEGTYVIGFSITDENGDATVPTALTWTLMGRDESIINDRDREAISPLVASGSVVLSGDDLSITNGETVRYFLLEGAYDSTLGSDLPIKEAATFEIENLPGVPHA
ncbi:MAG: hypothetical protein PVJ39_04745 [Gammaproteobacteria bacterium]|jgi:hypothetical protein